MLKQIQADSLSSLGTIAASVKEDTDLEDYQKFEKTYHLKAGIEDVWYHYRYAPQTEIWDLSKITFGVIYTKENHEFIYGDGELYGLEEGNIYFMNLKVLRGIINLPVAFEITSVDPQSKTIEFSYLEGGKARGLQKIQLRELEDGSTSLIHSSCVKSASSLRDKYLYPYFHNKLLNEFHSNMAKIIDSNPVYAPDLIVGAR